MSLNISANVYYYTTIGCFQASHMHKTLQGNIISDEKSRVKLLELEVCFGHQIGMWS